MKKVTSLKLNGKMWSVWVGELPRGTWGICYDTSHKIVLNVKLLKKKPQFIIDTAIHEALHAVFPFLTEFAVEQAGTEIARLLARLGVDLDVDALNRRVHEE